MGQGQSAVPLAPRSHEQMVKELANRFAEKCFSPLELYSLKDNFKSLADREQDVKYLREDTLARFLEIPDILHVSPVVFHLLSSLGAFPFLSDAPAVLGLEQLVIVVTLLTERYRRVLAHGATDRRRLLFRSLAVYDRVLFSDPKPGGEATAEVKPAQPAKGFAVDVAVEDDGDDGDDYGAEADDYDDDLVVAALEVLDYANPLPKASTSGHQRAPSVALQNARIPADNFRKLLLLLLLVAPVTPQEQLSQHADRVVGEALENLRATAECVLATFLDVETSPGIKFPHFDQIVPVCFPFLFHGFNALFEHFLYSRNLDFSKPKPGSTAAEAPAPSQGGSTTDDSTSRHRSSMSSSMSSSSNSNSRKAATSAPATLLPPPLLPPDAENTILTTSMVAQLSFFLPGASLFHRLRLLFSGDNDGFSMGSFETKVFNWRAPTILLVQGTRVGDVPRGTQEAAFAAALPPRRFPTGSRGAAGAAGEAKEDSDTLVFGAYISQPWRLTNRECFGDSDCVLFQLAPVHDVFGASMLNHDQVAFVRPTAANQHAGGIAFGCPPPAGALAKAHQKQQQPLGLGHGHGHGHGQPSHHPLMQLGPLSLLVDDSFEFGVMTHNSGGGGAYRGSVARPYDFQERFTVEALEVWGCGGDAEAKVQAERWAWEAREAEARRRINLGTGDMEADRQLLEMAGLIGQHRSGGSV